MVDYKEELLGEIIFALDNINEGLLSLILKNRKSYSSEEDFIKAIKKFNVDYEVEKLDEEDASGKRKFIKINKDLIEVKNIGSISRAKKYNFELDKEEFIITLNRDIMEKSFYPIFNYIYSTELERDFEFEIIAKKLQSFNIIII